MSPSFCSCAAPPWNMPTRAARPHWRWREPWALPGPRSCSPPSALLIEPAEKDHHGSRPRPITIAWQRGRLLPGDDVVRRIEKRVDPSPPRTSGDDGRWELEGERLPV